MAANEMSLMELKAALKKDIRESNNHRDLAYAVLGNFSTDELIDHVLIHRLTQLGLMEKISKM